MADINIEKKNNSVLPWILGLVILAAVAFFAIRYFKGDNNDVVNAPADSTAVQQAPAYQPAPPPASTDTIAGDSTKVDSLKGTTTSSQ